jgi:predicted MPP superfamily phosphohydrolase
LILRLLVLVTVVLSLLVGTHLLIYLSVVRWFSIDSAALRRLILTALLLLSVSMPASMLLVKNLPCGFTQALFAGAALWIGFFVNLLLTVGAAALIMALARIAGLTPNPRWIAITAWCAALLVTGWGGWRALHPEVHRVDVRIQGLPAPWHGKTVVHLSDLHLGWILNDRFMTRVAERVNELAPEMVLITGDLFDALGGDFPSYAPAIDKLKAKQGVFFVSGNHETYNEGSVVREALTRTGLQMLDNDVVDVNGIRLVGVGFPGLLGEPGRRTLDDLRRKLSGDAPNILLFHTPTSIEQTGNDRAEQHFTTYWFPDTSCSLNKELGIDLQLSGHTHAGQIFPFGFVAGMIYKGRDRGLHRDGSFQLYTSSGTGTFGPPLRTAGRSEITAIRLLPTENSLKERPSLE